jgi:hypothetical protein
MQYFVELEELLIGISIIFFAFEVYSHYAIIKKITNIKARIMKNIVHEMRELHMPVIGRETSLIRLRELVKVEVSQKKVNNMLIPYLENNIEQDSIHEE